MRDRSGRRTTEHCITTTGEAASSYTLGCMPSYGGGLRHLGKDVAEQLERPQSVARADALLR